MAPRLSFLSSDAVSHGESNSFHSSPSKTSRAAAGSWDCLSSTCLHTKTISEAAPRVTYHSPIIACFRDSRLFFFQKSTQESGLCFFLAGSCARATRCPQDTSKLLGAGTGAMQPTPAQRILLPGPLLCEIASSPERKKFCSWVHLKRSGQLEDDFTRFGCLPLQIRAVASATKLLQEVAGAPKTPTCNWDSCTQSRRLRKP